MTEKQIKRKFRKKALAPLKLTKQKIRYLNPKGRRLGTCSN